MAASEERNLYLRPGSKAEQLYERAKKVMPGGNTRVTIFSPPYPFYGQRGYGCKLVDEEGQERIDFFNNATTLILGHADPTVTEAVISQVQKGSVVGCPTESEVRLSEIITSRVPTVDHIRYCNSGSEAVMFAIKAARSYTGRSKIAKFEGCYHGSYDEVEVSLDPSIEAAGDPKEPNSVHYYGGASPRLLEDVIAMPFNDVQAVESLLAREKDSVAAVVMDALPGRIAYAQPMPGFVSAVREITQRYGMLLISDEVMSFRLGYRGTQPLFGYEADLTAFGKIIGGGYPVGAVGGSAEVMSVFDGTKGRAKLPHYGTFNANPVTMVAGIATMEQMTPEKYAHIDTLGDAVRSQLNALFQRTSFPAQASGKGSMFKILMSTAPIVDYRTVQLSPQGRAWVQDLYIGLLARGVIVSPALQANTSTPMSMKEVEFLVAAVEDWVHEKGY